jgi:DNA-binding LytR/AlgR family response regulator
MDPLTALIVDDEPAARRDLVEVLATVGDVRIVAQASDAASARSLARRHRPDLIFLDIQLPGADGFSALEGIDAERSCVIFTTAYAQFAIRAFEVGATDYLLKPVEEERCRRAIGRAREALRRQAESEPAESIEVEQHGAHVRVPAGEIRLLAAGGNYVEVLHQSGRGIVRGTMEGILAALPAGSMIRVNRHQAVRAAAVKAWSGNAQKGWRLVLRDGTEVSVSRRRAAEVLARLRSPTDRG